MIKDQQQEGRCEMGKTKIMCGNRREDGAGIKDAPGWMVRRPVAELCFVMSRILARKEEKRRREVQKP